MATKTLFRCGICYEYRCGKHAANHDCSKQTYFYEIDGKPVTKAQWRAYERKHGPFNPPPTTSAYGGLPHATPYRCMDCPSLLDRL